MKYEFELCKGRHQTPAAESIFDSEIDPTAVDAIEKIADSRIPDDATEIVVYVTGLTVAMLAVVSVCIARGIKLVAMHYDRTTGTYYRQLVMEGR